MDDKDRTIRIQQGMLEDYEKKNKTVESNVTSPTADGQSIETVTCATQTERVSFSTPITAVIKLNKTFFFFYFYFSRFTF